MILHPDGEGTRHIGAEQVKRETVRANDIAWGTYKCLVLPKSFPFRAAGGRREGPAHVGGTQVVAPLLMSPQSPFLDI